MASRVPKIVPKGTPLSVADPTQFSVLSYNCLAPIYVRPIDARTGESNHLFFSQPTSPAYKLKIEAEHFVHVWYVFFR
jgi:hypothetical protein